MEQFLNIIRRWGLCLRRGKSAAEPTAQPAADPPPPPRELISNRVFYEGPLLGRRVLSDKDTPLAALYRIYEHLCLDQHLEIRNELEAFWYHYLWAVRDIPDPRDPDPERYTCLACVAKIICLAFNARIRLGLPRDAPPIFTHDMLDMWRSREPHFEEEPAWVAAVPRLAEMLGIPHWDNEQREFVTLSGFENEKASPEFQDKNILIWQPHIHFL